jgi:predicted enzyme related to lactoylglutathione lyase
MSERDVYPPGVPCWVETLQPDPEAARQFYASLFGWEFDGPGPMPGDPPGQYFVARLRGRVVAGIGSGGPETPVAWNTHVSVGSADETARLAVDSGGGVLVPPVDAPPAGRFAVLADPAGATFCIWQPEARQGAQVINEAGAWAMSMLSTPDPERASAFYGAVFGWQMEPFQMGVTLCRATGYVGGEPLQPVPRDVVAALAPAGSDAGSRWGVDFWVADVDGTAARAADTGGKVIAGPEDTPGFRRAVLCDPSGAAFSVSRVSV